jgi:hypothetical protein
MRLPQASTFLGVWLSDRIGVSASISNQHIDERATARATLYPQTRRKPQTSVYYLAEMDNTLTGPVRIIPEQRSIQSFKTMCIIETL